MFLSPPLLPWKLNLCLCCNRCFQLFRNYLPPILRVEVFDPLELSSLMSCIWISSYQSLSVLGGPWSAPPTLECGTERSLLHSILVWGEMSRGWSSGRPVHCLALQMTSVTQPLPDASLSSLEKLSLVLPFVPEQYQGCELLLSFSFPADNT